jgi:hypothetical protein
MEHPIIILVRKFIVWWFIGQVGVRRVIAPTAAVVNKSKAFAGMNKKTVNIFHCHCQQIFTF